MREKRLFIGPAELDEIRRGADWREVFLALGIERAKRPGRADDWWALSPFRAETRPSFHMNEKGFHCFSSGRGGGVIELVQEVLGVDCYAAGRWLVENGLSRCSGGKRPLPAAGGTDGSGTARRDESEAANGNGAGDGTDQPAERESGGNRPIRQDLLPLLTAEHPELVRRGISLATAAYLGCGYLPEGGKSPLSGRLVFQVRGVRMGVAVILSHIGRALTAEQEAAGGKWYHYRGFKKSCELYNIDHLLLDPQAAEQAQASGHILLTEGCFDIAALAEAGILNGGATFGAHLAEEQLPRLKEAADATGISRFRVWYDRDPAGREGQEQAVALINGSDGLTADGFDWEAAFPSPVRVSVQIPDMLTDPGEFSGEQLKWLREQGVI